MGDFLDSTAFGLEGLGLWEKCSHAPVSSIQKPPTTSLSAYGHSLLAAQTAVGAVTTVATVTQEQNFGDSAPHPTTLPGSSLRLPEDMFRPPSPSRESVSNTARTVGSKHRDLSDSADDGTAHSRPTKKSKSSKAKGKMKAQSQPVTDVGDETPGKGKAGEENDEEENDEDNATTQAKRDQRHRWLKLLNDPILAGLCIELLHDSEVIKILMTFFRRTHTIKTLAKAKAASGKSKGTQIRIGSTLRESIWLGILANRKELDYIFRRLWRLISTMNIIQYQSPSEGSVRSVETMPNPYKNAMPPLPDDRAMRAIVDTVILIQCSKEGIPEIDASASDGTERKYKKFLVHWLAWSTNKVGERIGFQWSLRGLPTDSPIILSKEFQDAIIKELTQRGKARTTTTKWSTDYNISIINEICGGGETWEKVFRPVNELEKWVQMVTVKGTVQFIVLRVTQVAREGHTRDMDVDGNGNGNGGNQLRGASTSGALIAETSNTIKGA